MNLLEISPELTLIFSNIFISLFCLFLLIYMRLSLENKTNSTGRKEFKRVIVIIIACVVSDMLCFVFDGLSFYLTHIIRFIFFMLSAFLGYWWNYFFDVLFHLEMKKTAKYFLYAIPFYTMLVLLVANLFTGWIYTVASDGGYARGILYSIGFMIQYIPYAVIIFRALNMQVAVSTLRIAKMRHGVILLAVCTLVFGILQMLMGSSISYHSFGATAGAFVIFIKFQDDRITNDKLTGLSNRYALDSYLVEKMQDYSLGSKVRGSLYLLMIDINSFKKINDIYGHMEGDRALKCVSDSLKAVGGNHGRNLFLARFGGDEFCAVYEASNGHAVEDLICEINDQIKEYSDELEYALTVTTGFSVYDGKGMSMDMWYSKADAELYRKKRNSKM